MKNVEETLFLEPPGGSAASSPLSQAFQGEVSFLLGMRRL